MAGLRAGVAAIWRLTYPFFTTRDETELRIWPFGSARLQERWVAIGMAIVVIGIEFAQVAINVRLSYFNRDWFNAIQARDAATFWNLLLTVFCLWAAIFIASGILQYVVQSYLRIRWRRWMTKNYVAGWLDRHNHYRMQMLGTGTDNPDQRIADDIDQFTQQTQALVLRIVGTVSTLVSFSVILWQNSAGFHVPGTTIQVPGFLVWGVLVYSALFTWLTHLIGRPLIGLLFEQQRFEANFRFAMARLREYGEQVALLSGEKAESERLRLSFSELMGNFFAIVSRQKKLTAFTLSYAQVNVVIPYILVAPYYFAGIIPLGVMTQTAGAFGQVQGTMSFFITLYASLAQYKAIVDRLTTFDHAIETAGDNRATTPLVVAPGAGRSLRLEKLRLVLPDGRRIVSVDDLTLEPGRSVLLTGPSGSGKSTLFRAIAGIWSFGEGQVVTPEGASLMLLPQRPYLPMGTLRGATAYPAPEDQYGDAAIREALEAVRLPLLADRLDEERFWTQTLSLGEQQRLAIARALLAKPDWLFLDEATAALDEPTEAEIYRILRERLPGTTIVSIGHRSTLTAFHEQQIAMQPDEGGMFAPRLAPAPAPSV